MSYLLYVLTYLTYPCKRILIREAGPAGFTCPHEFEFRACFEGLSWYIKLAWTACLCLDLFPLPLHPRLPTWDMAESKHSSDDKGSIEGEFSPVIAAGKVVSDEARLGDEEYGGTEERRRLERKLLWKLDCRMSVMIVIYILNYVGSLIFSLRIY